MFINLTKFPTSLRTLCPSRTLPPPSPGVSAMKLALWRLKFCKSRPDLNLRPGQLAPRVYLKRLQLITPKLVVDPIVQQVVEEAAESLESASGVDISPRLLNFEEEVKYEVSSPEYSPRYSPKEEPGHESILMTAHYRDEAVTMTRRVCLFDIEEFA